MLPLSACSTSLPTRSESIEKQSGATEREALQQAVEDARQTRWTKPEKRNLGSILTGVVEGESDLFTRENAIVEYVALLRLENDPAVAMDRDVQSTLKAVDQLILVSEETLEALNPRMSDVDLLENVIADLGETRTIYLKALSYIERDTLNGEKSLLRNSIKASFGSRLLALGDVADDIADFAHNERKATIAARKDPRI